MNEDSNKEASIPIPKLEIELKSTTQSIKEKTVKDCSRNQISEVKKKSTLIKNAEGLLPAILFVEGYIMSHTLDFDDKLSLYKKVVPYMKKEESFTDEKIIDLIKSHFITPESTITASEIADIGDLLARVNNKEGIKYLQAELGNDDSDGTKDEAFVQPIILMAELLLKELCGDEAFRAIQRATIVNRKTLDKFDYLINQKKIAELASNICLYGFNKPHYESYIQQQIVLHIIDIAREIIQFPHNHELYRLKKMFAAGDLEVFDAEKIELALSHFNLYKYKAQIVEEVNDFTFNVLPIKMGIPLEYNSVTKLDNILNKAIEHGGSWRDIERIKSTLNIQDGKELLIALEFAEDTFQKYYNMEN